MTEVWHIEYVIQHQLIVGADSNKLHVSSTSRYDNKGTMHWRYGSLEVEALERKVEESGREKNLLREEMECCHRKVAKISKFTKKNSLISMIFASIESSFFILNILEISF